MDTMAIWARDQTFPSWFTNALGKALSVLASEMYVGASDATHVTVSSSANAGATVLSIEGRWRWNEADVTVAHPGGAAGDYTLYATAKNNDIVNVPAAGTDNTDYSFGLVIRPFATPPVIVAGVLDIYRAIATVHWDGAAITRVKQSVPASPQHSYTHAVGGADALSPADIGAATAAALAAEIARAGGAEPTAGELAALAGTSGAPAAGNKYVTDSDPRLVDSGWVNVALGAWAASNFPVGAPTLQSRKVGGFAYLQGNVAPNAPPNANVGTTTHHPAKPHLVLVPGKLGPLYVQINTDGTIVITSSLAAYSVGDYVSFDNVIFPLA